MLTRPSSTSQTTLSLRKTIARGPFHHFVKFISVSINVLAREF